MPITREDLAGSNDLTDNNTVTATRDLSDREYTREITLNGAIVPYPMGESWEEHFLTNGWSTFQNAIDAGYTKYLQPTDRQVANFVSANTERLKVADNAALSITGAMTISGWFYFNTTTSQALVGKWLSTGDQRSYLLQTDGNSKLLIARSASGTALDGSRTYSTAVSTGQWYHVVAKIDGTNMALLLDNVAESSATGGSIFDSTADFYLGSYATGSGDNFNGRMRCVNIWNRALSTDEITELYNNGVPIYYNNLALHLKTGLVASWDLNEKSTAAGAITRLDSHSTNDLTDENTVASTAASDTAFIERIIDFGTLLSGSIVTVVQLEIPYSPSGASVTTTTKIATSTDGITFDSFVTGSSLYVTTVQAIKIRLEFTGSNDTAFSEIQSIRVRLNIKKVRDSGTLLASADDDGGTVATFNKNYLDVETITVTPKNVQKVAFFNSVTSEDLSIADNADISVGDIDFSIAGWVWFDVISAGRGIFCKWNPGGSSAEYTIILNGTSNKLEFQVSNDGTATTTREATTFGAVQKRQWYFIVAEHDATANTLSIQVNNGAVDTTSSYTSGVYNGSAQLTLGSQNNASYLDGRMANWGLWKRTLTTAERSTLFNAGYTYLISEMSTALKTSLTAFWPLSESSGTRSDAIGSNNLTDNNTVLSYTIAKTAYVDFLDIPNPTEFSILVHDSNGIRVSSSVDWISEGFIVPV